MRNMCAYIGTLDAPFASLPFCIMTVLYNLLIRAFDGGRRSATRTAVTFHSVHSAAPFKKKKDIYLFIRAWCAINSFSRPKRKRGGGPKAVKSVLEPQFVFYGCLQNR
eukprot:GEMP01092588.1.p1 GENE.GEMP01092588.1~~GEMP01092588.1.p1  ORF type:complete len:108 (-),score=2.06 GEMP01092588.1:18-341(-)